MSKRLLPLVTFVSCLGLLMADGSHGEADQGQADDDDVPLPAAGLLMDQVRARLPHDPLTVFGDLKVRERKGMVVHEIGIKMALNLGTNPAVASYTVLNADGKAVEQLTLSRQGVAAEQVEYLAGIPLKPTPTPNLFDPIHGTGMSWADLSFSFLWWPGGETTGTDVIRGRDCYIVDITAPGDRKGAEAYARVRLWIDQKLFMILQAEGHDAAGEIQRRLWVKSVKKIKDRWMIKDLEVASSPFVQRTRLTIRDVDYENSL